MVVLVTGGASSGKSAFAEQLALSLAEPHVYAATMRHGDAETEARIDKHRASRAGKGFVTVELASGMAVRWEAGEGEPADMMNLRGQSPKINSAKLPLTDDLNSHESLGTVPKDSSGSIGAGAADVESELTSMPAVFPVMGTVLLEDLSNLVVNGCAHVLPSVLASENVVVVANEIGCDGARYDEYTLGFIEQLGSLACGIAARADVVVEVVAGLPNVVKGELPWA